MNNAIFKIIETLFEKYKNCSEGAVADYIPELNKADPNWFGICIFTTDGHCYEIGDSHQPFTIQSISKAFTYGMMLDEFGLEGVKKRIGVEPSGEAFNSISLDPKTGRPLNPMINAGAIAATGMVPGSGFEERFDYIQSRFSQFAGQELGVNEEVYESEKKTGFRNLAIANLLRNFDMLDDPVQENADLYFKQCSMMVTCRDLAAMAGTLANGGVNPISGERVLAHHNVEKVLSVMSTCGMYDYSGEWIFNVGLPAKSGVGGGVVGVLPGQLGIAVFSPPLDERGNSVRGLKVFAEISELFNLHLFNYPVISGQAIRRIYDLSKVRSFRQRSKSENDIIFEYGSAISVIEFQGDIFFSALERIIRAQAKLVSHTDVFVLDLGRVGEFDIAIQNLLVEVVEQIVGDGKRLIFIDPKQALNITLFHKFTEQVTFFDDIDLALEHCENELIELRSKTHLIDGLYPFDDFDLFNGMSEAELAKMRDVSQICTLAPFENIVSQGDDPDNLYLLAKGTVSIYLKTESSEDMGEKGKRLVSFGPGICFGDIAMIDGRKRSADVRADDQISCYTLSREEFDELEKEDPVIYSKLIKNILLMNVDRLNRSNREISALKGREQSI